LVLFLLRLPNEVQNEVGKDATKLASYGEELVSPAKKKGKQQKPSIQLNIQDQSWV
jgi:hypothetical protein